MTKINDAITAVQETVHNKDPHQTEFLQAVDEFLSTVKPFLEKKS